MNIDRNMLTRYFQGECSEWEKEAIRVWLESDESHKKQFIRERIRFDASVVIDEDKLSHAISNRRKIFLWNTLKIASAIFILIASSYCFSLYKFGKPESSLQSIYVPSGSRTSVTLPDGTLVWLNSNTSFKYPTTFASEDRIVELDGEAYFEVTKNEKKSFIVKTNKYNVEVLGTTFNVEAYAKEPTFKTGLFTGKVKLYKEQKENESLYLNPGEAAELIGDVLHVSSANQNSFRWKDPYYDVGRYRLCRYIHKRYNGAPDCLSGKNAEANPRYLYSKPFAKQTEKRNSCRNECFIAKNRLSFE